MNKTRVALLSNNNTYQAFNQRIDQHKTLGQYLEICRFESALQLYPELFQSKSSSFDAVIIEVDSHSADYEGLVTSLSTHFPQVVILLLGDPDLVKAKQSNVTVINLSDSDHTYVLNALMSLRIKPSSQECANNWVVRYYDQRNEEKEARHYKALIDNAGEGIIGLDNNGLITFANPSAADLLGVKSTSLIGQNITDYILDINYHQVSDKSSDCAIILEDRKKVGRSMLVRSNNKTTYVEYTQSIIPGADDGTANVLVIEDIGRRLKMETKLTRLACTDSLTGLYNRFYFEKSLRKELACRRESQQKLVLAVVDLDGFKNVNDQFGHCMGDKLLLDVANRLRDVTRRGDLVARLGGDEFTLLIKCSEHESANEIGYRIQNRLNQRYIIDEQELKVTASIGIHEIEDTDRRLSHCLEKADQAMYAVKHNGKNGVGYNAPIQLIENYSYKSLAS